MSREQNITVFRCMIEEGFNKGNLGALDALFATHYQEHQFQLPATLQGIKESIIGMRASFPDLTVTIDDVIADEDKVWVRSTARGTHRGEYLGKPPTGIAIEIAVIDICRFESGKIVEHWGVPDRYAQLVQLGILPLSSTTTEGEWQWTVPHH